MCIYINIYICIYIVIVLVLAHLLQDLIYKLKFVEIQQIISWLTISKLK